MNLSRLRILSIIVVLYMILALTWWAILLNKKNIEVFNNKLAFYEYEQKQVLGENIVPIKSTPYYEELNTEFNNQKKMIYGEAFFFAMSLVIGIWLINRAYIKEMEFNKRQNNFLLSITHEFKSPLASIVLVFDTFKSRILNKTQHLSLVETGISESKRLESLVNNLLLSAKLEAEYNYNYENIDMKEIIEGALLNYELLFSNKKIITKYDGDQDIYADKESMISVVRNLIENAIKYSKELTSIYIVSQGSKNNYTFIVRNNGLRLADSEKKKIFEKFYRIGSENTRKTKGTGMGLYIVNKIVNAHQGKISIETKTNNDCSFIIKLPQK